MNVVKKLIYALLAAVGLIASGCAVLSSEDDGYSSVPWNTSQEWEGSRSFPGMPSGY